MCQFPSGQGISPKRDFDWCGGISIRRPIIEEITYNDNIVGCLDNIWTSVYFVNHIRGINDGLGTRIKIYIETHILYFLVLWN